MEALIQVLDNVRRSDDIIAPGSGIVRVSEGPPCSELGLRTMLSVTESIAAGNSMTRDIEKIKAHSVIVHRENIEDIPAT